MSGKRSNLDALRREIDQLDERIHDLLMERAAALARIVAVKGHGGSFLRPGREAQILRRLIARHEGALPAAALGRIWRELISALYRLQGPLKVAVYAPERSAGYWDLGRNHFGSVTPMTLHRSANTVLRAVSDGTDTVGLLTLPQDGENNPWWPSLAFATPNMPRVLARLPFVDDPLGRFEDVGALLIAAAAPEPSGDDVSLVAIAAAANAISRGRLAESLQRSGLSGRVVASIREGGEELYLFELAGFVTGDDQRLAALIAASDGVIRRIVAVGAFAQPIRPKRA